MLFMFLPIQIHFFVTFKRKLHVHIDVFWLMTSYSLVGQFHPAFIFRDEVFSEMLAPTCQTTHVTTHKRAMQIFVNLENSDTTSAVPAAQVM
jgi:hypothetical protein